MTTIEKELANAYGEVIDAEIEATLASADPDMPELSPEFKKKMEELIRTGKPNNKKKGLSKRGKRILLIAIAAVLALTLTACAVPEIRESIAGFFVKLFNDHVEYSDPEITKDSIEEKYGLVPIPDGFAVDSSVNTSKDYVVVYSDKFNNTLKLQQSANRAITSFVDNETGEYSECNIAGRQVRIYQSDSYAQASWIENGYYFFMSYSSYIDRSTFETWISLVSESND